MKHTYIRITKEKLIHEDITCNIHEECTYRIIEVAKSDTDIPGFIRVRDPYTTIKETRLPMYAFDYINSILVDYTSFIVVDNCVSKCDNKENADITSFDRTEYYIVAFSILNMLYHTHGAVFVDLRIIGDTSETGVGFSEKEWIHNNYAKVMCDKRFKLMPAIFENSEDSLLIAMLDDNHTNMLNNYIRLYNAE